MTDIPSRLRELAELRAAYRDLQRRADDLKDSHDRLQEDVFDTMRNAGLTSVGTDDEQFVAKSTIYATVADLDEFLAWAASNGLEAEFTEINAIKGRLNELVRQRLQDGEELPPGLDFYRKNYISKTQK